MWRNTVGDGAPVPLAVRPDHRRKYCIFALRATDSCPYDDTNEKYVGIDDLGNPFAAGEKRINAKRNALTRRAFLTSG